MSAGLPTVFAAVTVVVLVSLFPATVEGQGDPEPCSGDVPTPTAIEVGAVPIVVESTTEDYFVLYVEHDLDGATVEIPVLVKRGAAGTTTLAENVEALPKERYRVEKYLIADPADVDGDCVDDITELDNLGSMNPVNPAAAIELSDGAVVLPDRETVETLSFEDSSGTLFLKFLLIDMDTDRPLVYFQNTERVRPHIAILHAVGLTGAGGLVRGAMIYDPELVAPDGSLGVYRYWLGDRYDDSFSFVARTHTLLAASMPLLEDNLVLWIRNHALLDTQSDLPLYQASRINLVFDEDVFAETSYVALNPGEGYGLLRVREPDEHPHPRDVVIYEALPNELPRVAGIVSTVPQTPLSHVNLRAVQDGIPNAFIRDALDEPDIASLVGSYVRYEATETGYSIRAATPAEVDAHYAASQPAQAQTPQRDLTVTAITPLSRVGFEDWTVFGVKAANVAVLRTLGFPEGTVPDGFAVPFYFYDKFMTDSGLYDDIKDMLATSDFQTDFDTQESELKKLRKAIKDAETPEWMTTALTTMHATFPVGISLRYRSSTNNEDLPGFNGAGLYDSKTQHPEETEEDGIAKSLKQVYASLWNFRAFIERDFHRIDHLEAAMGVLVHPNYSDELVNGVAVSFDPAYSTDGSYYVNSQIGEDLVTNPDAHSVPEEILLNSYGTHTVVAISNQVLRGQLLMSNDQLDQLRDHLTVIHDHFAVLYNPGPDEPFAMEIEFKITSDNILAIKQARPWIFTDGALGSGGLAVGRGNALTASFDNPPATHDGNAFSVRFRFSDKLLTPYKEFRDHAVAVTGGALTDARRLDGRSDRWEIDVTPDSYADVRLVLAANRRCTVPGAICTSNGRRLSSPLEHTVEGPPSSPGSGGGGGGGFGGGGGGPRTSAPGAPRNLTAVVGNGEVVLTWEAPASDGGAAITDYEYRIDRRNPWISIGSTDTTHTVTGLVNGTEYVFEVRAVNRIGKSFSSTRAEATPEAPEVFTLDFAHFANGTSITSDLVLVNVAPQPVRPVIYFYDQQGYLIAPDSVVDVMDDLEITEDGSLSVSTEMDPLGVLTISTHGRGELVSGSVKVVSEGLPIGGGLRYNLPAIGEAVVGASPPVGDALFPVRRQEGGINTGVAIHNLGEEAMEARCELMREGVLRDFVSISLEANGQTSWMIDQAFPTADTSDFTGSVRCDAVGQGLFSAVALEMDPGTRIFTTLPLFPVDRGGGGREAALDFAHFVNGTWITDLVFVNLSTEASRPAPTPFHTAIPPSRPVIYFYDTEGALVAPESVVDVTGDLEITEDGALTVQTEMEPLGVLTISTHGRGELVSGSARVVSDGPIGGMLRFDHPDLGVAGVGASPPVSDALFLVRRQEGGITTGVALHNLESSPGLLRCDLMREGVLLDAASIPLEANGQTSWLIDQAFPAADTSDFAGSVRCDAVGEGLFSAVALEMDSGNRTFTTPPVFRFQRGFPGNSRPVSLSCLRAVGE